MKFIAALALAAAAFSAVHAQKTPECAHPCGKNCPPGEWLPRAVSAPGSIISPPSPNPPPSMVYYRVHSRQPRLSFCPRNEWRLAHSAEPMAPIHSARRFLLLCMNCKSTCTPDEMQAAQDFHKELVSCDVLLKASETASGICRGRSVLLAVNPAPESPYNM